MLDIGGIFLCNYKICDFCAYSKLHVVNTSHIDLQVLRINNAFSISVTKAMFWLSTQAWLLYVHNLFIWACSDWCTLRIYAIDSFNHVQNDECQMISRMWSIKPYTICSFNHDQNGVRFQTYTIRSFNIDQIDVPCQTYRIYSYDQEESDLKHKIYQCRCSNLCQMNRLYIFGTVVIWSWSMSGLCVVSTLHHSQQDEVNEWIIFNAVILSLHD